MESGITQREIGMLFNIGATRVKQINEKTKNKMRVIEDISDIKWLLSRTK
jgi:DNA-directed RNA polymerase sigma subunit (sigma70/sigma32)